MPVALRARVYTMGRMYPKLTALQCRWNPYLCLPTTRSRPSLPQPTPTITIAAQSGFCYTCVLQRIASCVLRGA